MMIKVDDDIIANFEANASSWEGEFTTDKENFILKIEHYGKNYTTDHSPDKYFKLKKIFINDVDLKHHIHKIKQRTFTPPWDTPVDDNNNLYLGHNGYLYINLTSPVDSWIKILFNVTSETMHGQSTTKEVLNEIKKYFDV